RGAARARHAGTHGRRRHRAAHLDAGGICGRYRPRGNEMVRRGAQVGRQSGVIVLYIEEGDAMHPIRVIAVVAGLMAAIAIPALAQAPKMTGTVQKIDTVPNLAGARCGNHVELTVLAENGKTSVLTIYDPMVHSSDLASFKGKKVEIDLIGETVVHSIRLAG